MCQKYCRLCFLVIKAGNISTWRHLAGWIFNKSDSWTTLWPEIYWIMLVRGPWGRVACFKEHFSLGCINSAEMVFFILFIVCRRQAFKFCLLSTWFFAAYLKTLFKHQDWFSGTWFYSLNYWQSFATKNALGKILIFWIGHFNARWISIFTCPILSNLSPIHYIKL